MKIQQPRYRLREQVVTRRGLVMDRLPAGRPNQKGSAKDTFSLKLNFKGHNGKCGMVGHIFSYAAFKEMR